MIPGEIVHGVIPVSYTHLDVYKRQIRKLGRVDHKDAFLDTDTLEKARGITIFSKQALLTAGNTDITCLLYTSPMANTLNKTYPSVSGIMTTVHSDTGDQMILDGPQRKGCLLYTSRCV